MSFNFNEEDLVKAGESKVFNDGKAGRVENVTVTVEQLGKEYTSESPNAPLYRVVFTDSEDRKTNRACFSIAPSDYPDRWNRTYEDTIKKEWAYLTKICEHTGGTKPMTFTDDKDLFAQVKSGMGVSPLNVFVNFGNKQSPKDRVEVRKWMPAVEAAGTALKDSKLVAGGIDQMSIIAADTEDVSEDDFFAA